MSYPVPATPRPSAAIVLLRPRDAGGVEVYMIRRHVRNEFAPDRFVFPGGSVKSADREAELVPGMCAVVAPGPTTLGGGFRVGALRECFEEAGVLLAWRAGRPLAVHAADVARFAAYRAGLQTKALTMADVVRAERLTLATDTLLHWAHWITPEALPLRFDTHFFLAEMPAAQEAVHDHFETSDGIWIQPEDALARCERGTMPLVFATMHQLRALNGLSDVTAGRRRFAGTTPRTIMPRIARRDGTDSIVLPDEE